MIGWPVRHSLSPVIHNAAFAALGLDLVYVPMPVTPERVAEAVAGLRALGVAGANVTMPHKEAVAEVVDERMPDAELLRAVNTVVVRSEALTSDTTPMRPGSSASSSTTSGSTPEDVVRCVFGAGGAARACVLTLARMGAASVSVVVRSPERAEPARMLAEDAGVRFEVLAFDAVEAAEADILVNATPLGARGEELPLPGLSATTVGVDLLYRPTTTPLQRRIHDAGGSASGGLGLLLHQAALSFELWTGQPAPLPVMSAAALAALADDEGGRSAHPTG